jgi:hypothetical protein
MELVCYLRHLLQKTSKKRETKTGGQESWLTQKKYFKNILIYLKKFLCIWDFSKSQKKCQWLPRNVQYTMLLDWLIIWWCSSTAYAIHQWIREHLYLGKHLEEGRHSLFQVTAWYLPGKNEENHKKPVRIATNLEKILTECSSMPILSVAIA